MTWLRLVARPCEASNVSSCSIAFAPASACWELPPLLASVTLRTGVRCLEIGTGLGWGTVGLLRHETSVSVVTTDYEHAILRRARASVQENQPTSRVSYAQVDAKALPFSSGRFDCVLSLYVLHHAAGYQRALREIARVLTPGGILLMIDLMRPRFVPQLPIVMAPDGALTRAQWGASFTACGLDVVRWQTRYLLGPLPRCSVVACKSAGRTLLKPSTA